MSSEHVHLFREPTCLRTRTLFANTRLLWGCAALLRAARPRCRKKKVFVLMTCVIIVEAFGNVCYSQDASAMIHNKMSRMILLPPQPPNYWHCETHLQFHRCPLATIFNTCPEPQAEALGRVVNTPARGGITYVLFHVFNLVSWL